MIGREQQECVECWPGGDFGSPGIPLARVRGTLTDPLKLEALAILDEEGHEIGQRCCKIIRWGFDADFQGTTQQHKLESEIGDKLAAIALAIYNGVITADGVMAAYVAKMDKFIEDAEGPRQRLLHLEVPNAAHGFLQLYKVFKKMADERGPGYVDKELTK